MKKLTIVLAILLIAALSASAQLPKPITAYIDGGITVPNGDASALYKSGYHFGVGAGFSVSPMLQVMPKIEYHALGSSLNAFGTSGGDQTVWMLGVDGRMSISAPSLPVKPFAIGGVGMAIGKNEAIMALATEILPETTGSNFYWNIGAGIEIGNIFVQARYVSIATSGFSTNYIPITLGMKF